MQLSDIPCTYANVGELIKNVVSLLHYIEDGIQRFVKWYREYYKN
jgi:hypothetical protein